MESDPQVMALTGPARAQSKEESRTRLKKILEFKDPRPYTGYWAGVEAGSGELVAWYMLLPVVDKSEVFEIGFMLRRDRWGKGYASELTQAVLNLIDQGQGIKVVAKASIGNKASQKVLIKCGFDKKEANDFILFEKII